MAFKIATYLDRIGLDQVPTTVDGLLALQQAQMRAIPYENIEVLLGDIPDLTENSIWAKLIDDSIRNLERAAVYAHVFAD